MTLDLFVFCSPGVERLLAEELRTLGHPSARDETGGVAIQGGMRDVAAINLRSRLAGGVLVRVGSFHARALGELERRASALPWERYVSPAGAVQLRVTCHKSRLYHTGAVTERVANAIVARTGIPPHRVTPARASSDDDDDHAAQRFTVRVMHDQCTVSADSSGAPLYRRGYRLATAKAPLRETLASALLAASGWPADVPLLDPMCGSGTIAIEGALIARRIPPGAHRRFAFMDWPDMDAALWESLRAEAMAHVLDRPRAPIVASDRDAGAVEATRANAARAGVADDIVVRQQALSACALDDAPVGWLVSNPPYGVRVGDGRDLRNLYAQLGNVARRAFGGWTVALLSADRALERQTRLPLSTVLTTRNGGLPVRLVVGTVPRTEPR